MWGISRTSQPQGRVSIRTSKTGMSTKVRGLRTCSMGRVKSIMRRITRRLRGSSCMAASLVWVSISLVMVASIKGTSTTATVMAKEN